MQSIFLNMPQGPEYIYSICCSPNLISSVGFMILFHLKYNYRKYKVLTVKNELGPGNWFCSTGQSATVSSPVLLVWQVVGSISRVLGP